MVETILGTRIREKRRQSGLTQAELARQVGISASYLNLIERNRRRIAGPMLRRIADALDVSLEEIDGAAERRLAETLTEVAHLPALAPLDVEASSAGELIGRFPGWARAIAALARSERAAQGTAQALSDRLTHDPFLGETVHKLLTRISSIRSASEILSEYDDIPADQRDRFISIILGEAVAMTDAGEALASYFDRARETERVLTPLDEVEDLFVARDNHFPELEDAAAALSGLVIQRQPLPGHVTAQAVAREHLGAQIDGVIKSAQQIETTAAATRARSALTDYAAGAVLMPMSIFAPRAKALGYDIEQLSQEFSVGVDLICHRLAALAPEPDTPRFGYMRANASGTIIEMLGLPGLAVPRYASACPLWILYRAQQAPETVLRQSAEFPNGSRFLFVARARNTAETGFQKARHYVTDMIAMTVADSEMTVYAPPDRTVPEAVGPACRTCPRTDCAHRVDDPLAG